MAYATLAQLKARFAGDADAAHFTDTGDARSPDDTVMNEWLDGAAGFMDSQFEKLYATPIDTTLSTPLADILLTVNLDLAQYKGYARKNVIPDAKQKVYDDAKAWCEGVGRGEIALPYDGVVSSTGARPELGNWGTGADDADSHRKFTRATQEQL